MSQKLLMIEDDARLAAMVADYLAQSGFAVGLAADGQQRLRRAVGERAHPLAASRGQQPGSGTWHRGRRCGVLHG